jgi:DNA-binding HxlR family transcriptional regulator
MGHANSTFLANLFQATYPLLEIAAGPMPPPERPMEATTLSQIRACPGFQRAVRVLSKRWTGLIVHALLERPCRFAELSQAVEGLSDRMLSERLKELEAEEIVERHVASGAPVRVEYSLTAKGRGLEGVLREMHRWAERWCVNAGAERCK